MLFRKICAGLLLLFAGTSLYFMQRTVSLERENRDQAVSIRRLEKEVRQMSITAGYFRRQAEQNDYLRFSQHVFKIKAPLFTTITETVFRKSREYGFNPYVIMALIQVESSFKPYAVSSAGAYGLMQVNYSVWKDALEIDFDKIFDINYNIDLGLQILSHYYQEAKEDLFLALHRYNNGYLYNNTAYNQKVIATSFFRQGENS